MPTANPAAEAATDYPIATGYPRVRQPRLVRMTPRRCLAVDGDAAPGGPEFEAAMAALYGAAYSLQFLLRDRGVDAHTSAPEALWTRRIERDDWSEGPEAFDPSAWRWTLLIPIAQEATGEDIAQAIDKARNRRPSAELDRLRVLDLDEGLVVEAMHVGPYETEPETIARMREVAIEAGLTAHGAHHEVYLGDPRRTSPENLRTVLRQPVRPAAA